MAANVALASPLVSAFTLLTYIHVVINKFLNSIDDVFVKV